MAAKNKGRRRYKECYKGREMVLGMGGISGLTRWRTFDCLFLDVKPAIKPCAIGYDMSGLALVFSTLTGQLSFHTVATRLVFSSRYSLYFPCTIFGGNLTVSGSPFLFFLTVPLA